MGKNGNVIVPEVPPSIVFVHDGCFVAIFRLLLACLYYRVERFHLNVRGSRCYNVTEVTFCRNGIVWVRSTTIHCLSILLGQEGMGIGEL